MNCPNCNSNLENLTLTDPDREKFEIDRCMTCGGFWLDANKLRRITQQDAEEIDLVGVVDKLDDYGLSCPKCFIPLEEYQHPTYEDLVLQRCPDCHGLWLKRGQIAHYLNLKKHRHKYLQPDPLGALSSRDRVLTSVASLILIIAAAASIITYQTGHLQLAADSIRHQADVSAILTLIILIGSLLIFALGILLALWQKHRTIKLLGWSVVIFSIMILMFLAYA